jgi:hypothetical protein
MIFLVVLVLVQVTRSQNSLSYPNILEYYYYSYLFFDKANRAINNDALTACQ